MDYKDDFLYEIAPTCYLDLASHELCISDSRFDLHLKPASLKCLDYMAKNYRQELSYEQILDYSGAWDFGVGSEKNVQDAISGIKAGIRLALSKAQSQGMKVPKGYSCIRNISKVGYQFVAKKEPRADANNVQTSSSAHIISTPVAPVSKDNYVLRPGIEADIRESIHANKVTVIRGLSGLGKSELARKVATDQSGFSTIIRLELGNDGTGHFDKLLGSDVSVAGVPDGKDPLQIKKSLLRTAGSECLIVVDNFNDVDNESFLEELVGNTGNASILITSQIQDSTLKEIFQNNRKLSVIAKSAIDLEDEKYQRAEFAPMVFCKHAGLSYYKLTSNEQSSVIRLCEHVANHTMIVAALGCRLKEYGGDVEDILNEMLFSVRECLDQDLVVQLPKDRTYNIKYLTPYEILKRLFNKVLSRTFTEKERQVLGAVILLPIRYRARHELEELVGDLKEAKCSLANSAVNKLVQDGVLKISLVLYPGVQEIIDDYAAQGVIFTQKELLERDYAKEELNLHPLYAQLFSDPEIKFFDKTGMERQGTIAEISTDFAFHLLNNRFVSPNIPQWHDYLSTYREMAEHMGLDKCEKQREASTKNKGWIAVLGYEFAKQARDSILSVILHNHKTLNQEISVTPDDLLNVLGYIPSDEELEEWDCFLNDIFIDPYGDIIPDSEISLSQLHLTPPWQPKHPSLFVVTEGSLGNTLWIVDHVTKKEYCVLNLCNQRHESYRYFKNTEKILAVNGTMERATLVDIMGDPQYLLIPSYIADTIPITTVQYGDLGRCSSVSVKIVCFPSTIKRINQRQRWLGAFLNDPANTRVVFLGETVSIGRRVFHTIPWVAKSVILPEKQVKLEYHSLAQRGLDHVVIPFGSTLEIVLPELMLLAYLDMQGTNCVVLPFREATVYYDANTIFSALRSENWETIEVYDQSGSIPLNWESLFEFLYQHANHMTEHLRIGLDFMIDEDGNIEFSPELIQAKPWIDVYKIRYTPSIPKQCRVYVRDTGANNSNMLPSKEADSMYLGEIIETLRYCLEEARMCIIRRDHCDANGIMQIATELLNLKARIIPAEIKLDILRKIDMLYKMQNINLEQ